MTIFNEAVLDEIKELVHKEVKKDINEIKLEDAKIIVQVLLPEIDRIITSKFNKFARRLAADIISWDLVKEEEESKKDSAPERYQLVDSGNSTHLEPIEKPVPPPDREVREGVQPLKPKPKIDFEKVDF